jgi:hypothetical protein
VLGPVVEKARIKATSTRSAALPKDMWIPFGESINDMIQPQHIIISIRGVKLFVDGTVVI